jgi:hypothetical protein
MFAVTDTSYMITTGCLTVKVHRNLFSGNCGVMCGQTRVLKVTDTVSNYAIASENWTTYIRCHCKVIHCQ